MKNQTNASNIVIIQTPMPGRKMEVVAGFDLEG